MVRKPRILLAVILLAAVVAGDRLVLSGSAGQWAAHTTAPLLQPLVAASGHVRIWAGTFFDRNDLVAENVRLQQELEQLRGAAADADALHSELEFTRAAAGLRGRLSADPIEAGIFSWYRAGTATLATINQGEEAGVAVGDAVITANGSFIGVVRDVYVAHATVTVIGDPTLQVAARIMGTSISGLVRMGEDSLIMDLVKKEELVKEGDLVLTSGNDQFPAGFVIGAVRSVDASQATLFSIVRINPAVTQPLADFVLVLRP